MKKIIASVLGTLAVIVLLLVGSLYLNNQQKALAGVASGAFNVIGTRIGTTTTEGGFYKTAENNGTTTVPINIGTQTDAANFTIRLTNASATPSSIFTYNIVGSNDFNCETATTTTTANNQVVKKNINWYSLATQGQLTSANATGTVVSLTNLTWQCLAFEANGSSTAALVQLITKDAN